MCFSLLASLSAGTVLTAAGAATVALARRRAERPLALIPLLFGVQQLVEGVVWWSLDHGDPALNVVSTRAYTLFSHVLWPVFVPFAFLCVEVEPWRRRVLGAAVAVGVVVALDGLWTVVRSSGTSHVLGRSIRYEMPGPAFIALYLLATCVGAMFSSHRLLRAIGAAALALAVGTLWLYTAVAVSLWCFFSAVLSVMIVGYFRSPAPAPRSVAV